MVLFSTDNFIISKLFGPEEVVPYNIAFKYFSIITMVYSILLTPYWSSFTEAYTKNDFVWIKKIGWQYSKNMDIYTFSTYRDDFVV